MPPGTYELMIGTGNHHDWYFRVNWIQTLFWEFWVVLWFCQLCQFFRMKSELSKSHRALDTCSQVMRSLLSTREYLTNLLIELLTFSWQACQKSRNVWVSHSTDTLNTRNTLRFLSPTALAMNSPQVVPQRLAKYSSKQSKRNWVDFARLVWLNTVL